MKKFLEGKIATLAIVLVTVTLAGIAIFTAVRLYQLRQEPIAPTAPSEPLAYFECTEYNLLVDVDGTVRIHNVTDESRPTQNIDLFVDGQSIGNFNIPALNPDEVAILGDLNLAPGDYNWSISGVPGCTGEGSTTESCQEVVFEPLGGNGGEAPTSTPTSTPSVTPTSTLTPTPTTPAVGGGPTSTPTNRPTSTPIPTNTSAPTSTTVQTSPTSEQLPDAGVGYPTIVLSVFGFLIVFFAIAIVI
jgi:hypothetical protein